MPNRYVFKTKPYKHQVNALAKLAKLPRGGALFMEMGTGKTKVAIDYACIQEQLGVIDQVLVVGPLSTLGVWHTEVRKHSTSDTLGWRIINYDKIIIKRYLDDLIALCQRKKVLLVLDESHRIKNAQAKRSKMSFLLGRLSQRVLLLTGTPISKNPLDVFSQFRSVDEGILGSSWPVFKRTYGVWGGYGGYQLVKYMNLGHLTKRIEPYTFQAKKDDCLDLPARTHEIVPIHLKESQSVYNQMAKDRIAWLEEHDTSAEAAIVLTKLLRLSQITGGFVKDDMGEVRQVGEEKGRQVRGLLEEFLEQDRTKVVVFCRFIAELKHVAEIAKDVGYVPLLFYGKTPQAMRDRRLARFEETQKPTVMCIQTATGSLGISLTAASEAIFYSHGYDYAEFAQACDRLHRIGQKRAVTYYHLVAQDTIDEAVWMALRTKRNLADVVLNHVELLSKAS
jgi:SNF2 family DNA or RNA helicase